MACGNLNFQTFFGLSAGLALLSGPAVAQSASRTVAENGALVLGHYAQVNPDCSSMGIPVVRISAPPAHGVVSTAKGSGFSLFHGAYQNCSSRRVAGVTAQYGPERGFVGSDSFALDVIFPGGRERIDSYSVTVK